MPPLHRFEMGVLYTVTSGLPELKAVVNSYFERFYGYSVASNQVTVAAGAKYSLYTFFMAVVNPGDEVIIPTPYWVSYGDQVKMAKAFPSLFLLRKTITLR